LRFGGLKPNPSKPLGVDGSQAMTNAWVKQEGRPLRLIWSHWFAASADAAIKRTIKEFPVTDPAMQRRLAAHRVS